MINYLRQLYKYNNFIISFVYRDFAQKYLNSVLGFAWSIIQPLSLIIIYTIIFSSILGAKFEEVNTNFSYSIYICSGILTWGLFAEIINKFTNMFIENANILKKIKIPKIIIPISVCLTSLLNFFIIFIIFLVFLIIIDWWPGLLLLNFFAILCLQIILSVSFGLILGTANVFFRDLGHIVNIFLQVLFWVTPIVYPLSIIPDWAKSLIKTNPLYYIFSSYHDIFLYHKTTDFSSLYYPFLVSLFFLSFALYFFNKARNFLVDEL